MPKPHKSGRLAALLAHITLAGAVALPVMAVAIWLFWDRLAPFAAENLRYQYDVAGLDVGGRLAGLALFLIIATIQAYGLLSVRQTFIEASQGRVFSDRSVNGFRRFAWISLIMVFAGIIQRTLLIVIFSLNDQSRQGTLSIQLGSNEMMAFFMALLLVFVAQVFSEGKRAADENETFL